MASSVNHSQYFKNVLSFLQTYQWLYNYSNVEILNTKHFHSVPKNWVHAFKIMEVNFCKDLPSTLSKIIDPIEFKEFIIKIVNLTVQQKLYNFDCNLTDNSYNLLNKVQNKKKRHEIERLANVVHDLCRRNDIDIIIDVGAGLGYISFLLYENFKYKILAIEGKSEYVVSACKYQNENCPSSLGSVMFINYFITENSLYDIEKLLKENFADEIKEKPRVCVVGLHACADLSITMLDIFSKMSYPGILAIMPCCYHRLKQKTNGQFFNFPLSNVLKTLSVSYDAGEFLKVPFLRLACQQTVQKFKTLSLTEIQKQSKGWMLRAILQYVAEEENCIVQRLKRKSGKFHTDSETVNLVEEYVNNIGNTHKVIYKGSVGDTERLIDESLLKQKLFEKWSEYEGQCEVLEFLSTFQTYIQTICENLVLLDRVQFLQENGTQCYCYKIVDDYISPRCHAIVAFKT